MMEKKLDVTILEDLMNDSDELIYNSGVMVKLSMETVKRNLPTEPDIFKKLEDIVKDIRKHKLKLSELKKQFSTMTHDGEEVDIEKMLMGDRFISWINGFTTEVMPALEELTERINSMTPEIDNDKEK